MSLLVLDIESVVDATVSWQPRDPDEFAPACCHWVVCAAGCVLGDDLIPTKLGVIGGEATEEEEILRATLTACSSAGCIITWNGGGFDLPVLATRAMKYGIEAAWYYRRKGMRYRFSEEDHLDLCDHLANHGATRKMKLDHVAQMLGIPGKTGSGAGVAALIAAGKWAEVRAYCIRDVVITTRVFFAYCVLTGRRFDQAAAEAALDKLILAF